MNALVSDGDSFQHCLFFFSHHETCDFLTCLTPSPYPFFFDSFQDLDQLDIESIFLILGVHQPLIMRFIDLDIFL
jgi:hypothetical protein